MSDISQVVQELRTGFQNGVLRSLDARRKVLRDVLTLFKENEERMVDALEKDLRRCSVESISCEVEAVESEIINLLINMEAWLKNESVPSSFITQLDSVYVQRQPYGLAFIISPWNFPISLIFQPLVGAIAAGNCVLVKPSEYAPTCANLMAELIPKYIDKQVCQVICGESTLCMDVLENERFDHIFFTGGIEAGRSVYMAAAKQLTPVTLELGGKCPTYIDSDVNLNMAVKRIAWSKLLNAGQVCLSPDYILCHEDILPKFTQRICETIKSFLGEHPEKSPDFARIINDRHFKRITNLLQNTNGSIVLGGDFIAEEKYIAPTVVTNVKPDDILMQEEIFAPILPILSVSTAKEAINFINLRPKPLAIYVFTGNAKLFHEFEQETTSGGIVQNDCIFHAVASELPFGGVGPSGIGNYHGRYSIETYSHRRAVMRKSTIEYFNEKMRYFPYTDKKLQWIRWALRKSETRYCSIM